jgi:5,5'-dehydrodivanillate O-demethylase
MNISSSNTSTDFDKNSGEGEIDIARVGSGTPGGIFLRQFWVPVYRQQDLEIGQSVPIKILGENFALYRGNSGKAQVMEYHCPHRRAPLHLGWVEEDALRCMYHGWKFDCTGECLEQPAEDASFSKKVKVRTYPTEEFLGLIYAYFGEGEEPEFPPYPAPATEGYTENPPVDPLPCNYLQSFENSLDEVHVAFAHRTGGSHEGIYDLPEISSEETDWGILRHGKRESGEDRLSIHYAPFTTRVIVPPMAGLEGAGGWRELYLHFIPIDDENQQWFIINHVNVTGEEKEKYLAASKIYEQRVEKAGSPQELAMKALRGEVRIHEIEHPELVRVQDAAMMVGQGAYSDRSRERLGKSDVAIILWRKILEREMRAIIEGKPTKKWSVAPDNVLPTFGF